LFRRSENDDREKREDATEPTETSTEECHVLWSRNRFNNTHARYTDRSDHLVSGRTSHAPSGARPHSAPPGQIDRGSPPATYRYRGSVDRASKSERSIERDKPAASLQNTYG
jgi:hypothetical protein